MAPGSVTISSVVVAELQFGIQQSKKQATNQAELDFFLDFVSVLDWPLKATHKYGFIRNYLKEKGTPIGPMDLLIAAHALCENATLVTNNTQEYERVPELRLENWAR